MNKQVTMLLCASILALGLTAAPAMASAGPFSPIEVETYTYGPLAARQQGVPAPGGRRPVRYSHGGL